MSNPRTDVPRERPARRRLRRALAVLVPVALVAGAAGLYWFQPWRLFTDTTVVEALPSAQPSPGGGAAAVVDTGALDTGALDTDAPDTDGMSTSTPGSALPPPADPPALVELSRGDLIPHEHATSGIVRLLELPDGSRVLRLEGLETSDGPDLRVWLTDAPVVAGRDGWFLFDDGRTLDLGALQGNRGDHNDEIPPEADLDGLTGVSIWCRRFAVSFGAAQLADM